MKSAADGTLFRHTPRPHRFCGAGAPFLRQDHGIVLSLLPSQGNVSHSGVSCGAASGRQLTLLRVRGLERIRSGSVRPIGSSAYLDCRLRLPR